jgi:hypothetical protein
MESALPLRCVEAKPADGRLAGQLQSVMQIRRNCHDGRLAEHQYSTPVVRASTASGRVGSDTAAKIPGYVVVFDDRSCIVLDVRQRELVVSSFLAPV